MERYFSMTSGAMLVQFYMEFLLCDILPYTVTMSFKIQILNEIEERYYIEKQQNIIDNLLSMRLRSFVRVSSGY